MTDRHARAAVDVGTNSVRLLILDGDGERLAREMSITRLGAGVDRDGRFDDEALERTLAVIGHFRDIWTKFEVEPRSVRIAATSAVRDAIDRDRFFEGVRAAIGIEAEVLSGDEEAALAFLGATTAVESAVPPAVLDIGGGSTELIVGSGHGDVAAACSLQLGSVRLTERFLASDPPTDEEIAEAEAEIRDRLDQADALVARQGGSVREAASIIGVAGTITTLAALYLGLPGYIEEEIHGTRMPADAVAEWSQRLLSMTVAERAALGPMQAGREDVIAAGALIAAGVMARYGFDEIVVSEADILDGLALAARE